MLRSHDQLKPCANKIYFRLNVVVFAFIAIYFYMYKYIAILDQCIQYIAVH